MLFGSKQKKPLYKEIPFVVFEHHGFTVGWSSQFLLSACSDAFFMDLKYQIARGDILIPNPKKAVIGAHIAQTEMGDFCESSGVVYPPYFPTWDSGISHIIRKEHRKLKGKRIQGWTKGGLTVMRGPHGHDKG